MGLINKLATKMRTKARTSPVNVQGPWENNGELIAAAAVRAAACSLGQMGLLSSSHRGNDFLGIKSARSRSRSTVWVEQASPSVWSIALGRAGHSYTKALDWMLRFEVTKGESDYEVEVTTPAVATKDGTQVHKDQYSEIRDLVLTGLASGQWPNVASENAVSAAGCKIPTPKLTGFREGVESEPRFFETSLTTEEIVSKLSLLPFQVVRVERPPTLFESREVLLFEQVHNVGIGSASGEATISVFQTADGSRRVEVRHTLAPGVTPAQVITIAQARVLGVQVFALLKSADPAAKEIQNTTGAQI